MDKGEKKLKNVQYIRMKIWTETKKRKRKRRMKIEYRTPAR